MCSGPATIIVQALVGVMESSIFKFMVYWSLLYVEVAIKMEGCMTGRVKGCVEGWKGA